MDAVGGYELLGRVAAGRTGTVWKARDHTFGRDVALKQVGLQSGDAITRLRAEARLLTGLAHPNLVGVIDLLEERQHAWLVEEWVDGVAVPALLASVGPLTPQQALGLMYGALGALAYTHQQAIVHGDVSPANILVDSMGTSKLVDYGLAAPSGVQGVAGTPGYLCPEAARGLPVSPRGDVYSAATVLAMLLRGRPVFTGDTAHEIVTAQRGTQAPDLSGIEAPVRAVLERALAGDERVRFADAEEFRQALAAAAAHTYGPDWLADGTLAGLMAGVARTTTTAPGPAAARSGPASADLPARLGPGSGASGLASTLATRPSRGPQHASVRAGDIDRIRTPRGDHSAGRPGPASAGSGLAGAFKVPGRLSATAAAIVVVAAISILVVMHATGTTAVTADSSSKVAKAFSGTYSVTETLTTPGAGSDIREPLGTSNRLSWHVKPGCDASGKCSALVTPTSSTPFTLEFVDGSASPPVLPTCSSPASPGSLLEATFSASDVSSDNPATHVKGTMTLYFACGAVSSESWSVQAARTGK